MTPREAERPRDQKLPEIEPLKFSWENFGFIMQEFLPVWKLHWQELAHHKGKVPLDPDWEFYVSADMAGVLKLLTVRDGGALVGYIFTFVRPHPHYASTLFAMVDMFWLHPDYRSGWAGVKLFKEHERKMKELGVSVVCIPEKITFFNDLGKQVGLLLRRLGYAPRDIVHVKYIGE